MVSLDARHYTHHDSRVCLLTTTIAEQPWLSKTKEESRQWIGTRCARRVVLDGLVGAIRDRAAGESALAAVRKALSALANRGGGGRPSGARAAFRRMVAGSTTLQNHLRTMTARYERALAKVLAEQTRMTAGSAEPFIASVALVGALRAGFETAEDSGGVGEAINRALNLLESGLANYAVAAHDPTPRSSRTAPGDHA